MANKKKDQTPVGATKETEEKALQTKPQGAITTSTKDEWDLGAVDSKDIIIPRLVILQSTSKLVQKDAAAFGDIANTVTGEILGSCREKERKPVKFIAFKEEKTWGLFEVTGTKPEFRGVVPITAENNDLEREYEENGKKFRRYRTLSYFVLLPEELEKGGMPLPYILTFRSTSFKAGRVLSTHFVMCKASMKQGKPTAPPSVVFELSGTKTQNDKGTFYVAEVTPTKEVAKPEWVQTAHDWLKTMRSSNYRVDATDAGEDFGDGDDNAVRDVKPGEVQSGAQF